MKWDLARVMSSRSQKLGSEILSSFVQRRTALIGQAGVDASIPLDQQVRLAVVLVVWEPDASMQTASMLERSLPSLQKQLLMAGIHADLLLVLNNGGGPSCPVQDQLLARVESLIRRIQPVLGAQIVETIPPESIESAAVSWAFDARLQQADFSPGLNQVVIVRQPSNPCNKGKIRGLRDVCQFLADRVLSGLYGVDLIYQIDAETTLSIDGTEGQEAGPIAALVAPFAEPSCQAVSSRERYLVFDDQSGEIIDVAVPAAQLALNQTTNCGDCSFLHGGSLMSRVPSYLAGISTLAQFTPGLGTEDYGYTSIILQAAKVHGLWSAEHALRLISQVRHVNRVPSSRAAAMRQFSNWILNGRAVDQLFPAVASVQKPFVIYCRIVMLYRLRSIGFRGFWGTVVSLWLDALDLPQTLILLYWNPPLPDIADTASPVMWTGDAVSVRAVRM